MISLVKVGNRSDAIACLNNELEYLSGGATRGVFLKDGVVYKLQRPGADYNQLEHETFNRMRGKSGTYIIPPTTLYYIGEHVVLAMPFYDKIGEDRGGCPWIFDSHGGNSWVSSQGSVLIDAGFGPSVRWVEKFCKTVSFHELVEGDLIRYSRMTGVIGKRITNKNVVLGKVYEHEAIEILLENNLITFIDADANQWELI